MTRFKKYTFKFPKKLRDDQKDILAGALQESVENVKKGMKRIRQMAEKTASMANNRFAKWAVGEDKVAYAKVLAIALKMKEDKINEYFKAGDVEGEENTYYFMYAFEDLTLLGKGATYDRINEMINEQKFLKWFKYTLFPRMGFNSGEVELKESIEEIE